jgi:poly(3-hydroxybutyrate) depolymerase
MSDARQSEGQRLRRQRRAATADGAWLVGRFILFIVCCTLLIGSSACDQTEPGQLVAATDPLPQDAPAPEQVPEQAPEPAAPASAPKRTFAELLVDLKALAPRLQARSAAIRKVDSDGYALARLKLDKADLIMRSFAPSEEAKEIARTELAAGLAIWQALVDGKPPVLATHGKLERAYLAASDESAQPYLLHVPKAYDGKEPFGMLVFLHGYSPTLNKVTWTEVMYSQEIADIAAAARCILVMPYARGNTDFQGAGEDDVMHVVGKVKKQYRIDPDRVFMSGISMGGMGAWSIAAHQPHEFAAVLALASRTDFYLWKQIERGSLLPWKRKMVRAEFAVEMTPNFRRLPSVIVHGLDDWIMPLAQSEAMNRLLVAAKMDVSFDMLEGVTHYDWGRMFSTKNVTDCLTKRKRVQRPASFTYRTWSLKHGRAYWAEVTAIDDWSLPVELDCSTDAAEDTLHVTTKNATALRILPGPPQHGQEWRVTWNGQTSRHTWKGGGWIELSAVKRAEGELWKTAELSGPLREAHSGPFLMVYDGGREGESFKNTITAAEYWLAYAQGMPRVVSADDITPEQIAANNLILFGTPEQNSLVAKIVKAAPALPIFYDKGAYRVGDKAYDAKKFGLSMIYPNPLAPKRYIVLNYGQVWGKNLASNHRHDIPPDFIIFNERTIEDGTDSNVAVCAGFFDQKWQLDKRTTWHMPEPPLPPEEPEEPAPIE